MKSRHWQATKETLPRVACLVGALLLADSARAALSPSGSDDAPAIQAAIDAAGTNGKVELGTGDWKLGSKLVVTNGVLLCGATGKPEEVRLAPTKSGVAFATVTGAKVVGLAMQGAWGSQVPALGVHAGGTVSNCIVRNCTITAGGGGAAPVTLDATDALMTHCVVSNNSSSTDIGNGTYRNSAGVRVWNGTLAWSLVCKNTQSYAGDLTQGRAMGGVYLKNGCVYNCTVVGNASTGTGGVWTEGGAVSNCIIAANTSSQSGSWMDVRGTSGYFKNCAVANVLINDTCVQETAYNLCRDYDHGDYRPNVGQHLVNGIPVGYRLVASDSLSVGFSASAVRGSSPLVVQLTGAVVGASGSVTYSWDLDGDGVYEKTSSGSCQSVTFTTAGSHTVGVKAVDSAGNATLDRANLVYVAPKTLYVKSGNANAAFPYDESSNAAADIQTAIDAAVDGCTVSVLSETYAVTTPIAIEKDITLTSQSGDPRDVIVKCMTAGVRGLWIKNASAKVQGITVTGASGSCPGAIYIDALGGTVSNCVVRGCAFSGSCNDCASIYARGSSSLVTHCVVTNNTIRDGCGNGNGRKCAGVTLFNGAKVSNTLVADCKFTTVPDTYSPGGIFLDGAYAYNCTVVDCVGSGCGGIAMNKVFYAGARAYNCVIANCKAAKNGANYDSIYAGYESQYVNCAADTLKINDTCVQDTAANLFKSVANGNYAPKAGSVLVDAGSSDASIPVPSVDVAGKARVVNGAIDIGAYEAPIEFAVGLSASKTEWLSPCEIGLTATVSGTSSSDLTYHWIVNGTESTTSTSTTNLQVKTPGEIVVKVKVTNNATEDETEYTDPLTLTVVPHTLLVRNGNAGAAFPYDGEGNAAATIQAAVDAAISGCTIEVLSDTYELTEPVTVEKGVTIRSRSGRPEDVIVRCTTAGVRGIWLKDPAARLEGVTVTGATGKCPGAIYIDSLGGTVSNCVVRGCAFSGSGDDGASICANGTSALVTHCVVTNNTIRDGCAQSGGRKCAGMTLFAGAKASNCLVADCKYTDSPNNYSPGGIFLRNSFAYNCTVVDCVGTECGGISMYAGYNTDSRAYNCVIANCKSSKAGTDYDSVTAGHESQYVNCAADTLKINDTCVQDTAANMFRNASAGNYAPQTGSVLVDSGSSDGTVPVPSVDLAGRERVVNEIIDIGAYEDPNEFAVGLSVAGTDYACPCTAELTALVSGSHTANLTYHWLIDGVESTSTESNRLLKVETAGDISVRVKVSDGTLGEETDYCEPLTLHVVPKTLWVVPGSENAASPYDTRRNGAADIATALAYAIDGCEIRIVRGRHALPAAVSITKDVTVTGETDDPADVVLLPAAGIMPLTVNSADAVLANLTVDGASGGIIAVRIDTLGGTVSNCIVRNTRITSNSPAGDVYGSAAAIGTKARFTRCVISNNVSSANVGNGQSRRGPGLSLNLGGRADNCLVVCNTNTSTCAAQHLAGGVYIDGGDLVNCTVADNYGRATGGVWIDNQWAHSVGTVRNCLIVRNGCEVTAHDPNFLAATGGDGGFNAFTAAPVACATDTILLGDDSVLAPVSEIFSPGGRRPYRPTARSRVVNAGSNEAAERLELDLRGRPRVFSGTVDIGCYENTDGGLLLIVR